MVAQWYAESLGTTDNKISESGDKSSFKVLSKFPESDFVVFRPFDTQYAKEAADWAIDVAKNHDVKYSTKGISGTY